MIYILYIHKINKDFIQCIISMPNLNIIFMAHYDTRTNKIIRGITECNDKKNVEGIYTDKFYNFLKDNFSVYLEDLLCTY